MGELETFVLGYLEQAGSSVEPAVYGVREVLLPEAVAERWHAAAYQQITFTETEKDDVSRLGYNHPLVEHMAEEARARPASTRVYINGLRLSKDGLKDMAAKQWAVLNGRVVAQPRATLSRGRSTYVRFNFKAVVLSHEKQERLVSVLMDAHSGCPVAGADADVIEAQATAAEPDAVSQALLDAPIRWRPGDGRPLKTPLDQRALDALLDRAKAAVLHQLSAHLSVLQQRVGRYRELDRARLTEYYDGLERDLQQRLNRASPDRRESLADKLEAVKGERTHKLADIAERYRVRLDLILLNLMVIQQPKLVLPVNIENRTTRVSVPAVWDPLLHRLEPLVCEVCGRPAERVALCHNGHLAHQNCLARACIDCKRVFCRQCEDEVGECDVCHDPLCRHSRIACDECGRGTCQEHIGMCHGNKGEPGDMAAEVTPPEREALPAPSKPEPKSKTRPRLKRVAPRRTRKARPALAPSRGPTPRRIEVVVVPDAVVAYVLASRERQIAMRVWELDTKEGGISIMCKCEKGGDCEANNMVMRPSEWQPIEQQMMQEITRLRQEYGLPAKQMAFNRAASAMDSEFVPMRRLELFGLWRDKRALAEARAGFDRTYRK